MKSAKANVADAESSLDYRRISKALGCRLVFGFVLAFVSIAGTAQSASPDSESIGKTAALDEIVVTARKREESVVDVPISITALSSQTLGDYHIQEFQDYANRISNLSFSAGSGAFGFADGRSVAIRGVGASLYRATTGFYIDDTPVPDNMDPRIVDIQRIEVLKGPQGTLYGSGSMGGNVKLLTNKPDLNASDFRYSIEGGYTRDASANYGGNVVSNFVVAQGRSAMRLMGFYAEDSGFIQKRWIQAGGNGTLPQLPWDDTTNPSNLQSRMTGGHKVIGASIASRTLLTDNLEMTLRLLYQRQSYDGWPVAYAPLPSFKVASLTENRVNGVAESSSDRWSLPSIEFDYTGHGWQLSSSTSYFDRISRDIEDGTEGTSAFMNSYVELPLATGQASIWYRNNTERQLTHETRVSFDEIGRFSGITGIYYSRKRAQVLWPESLYPGLATSGLSATDSYYFLDQPSDIKEAAVFGEIYVRLSDKLTATIGARYFNVENGASFITQDGWIAGGYSNQQLAKSTESGVSPKLSLLYKFTPDASIYASAAKGYRPGGNAGALPSICDADLAASGISPADAQRYKSDSLWSYEVGLKAATSERRLLISAAAFQINWNDIQQFVNLTCGFGLNSNSGAARIRGGEIELTGKPLADLDVRLSAGYLDGKITEQGIGPLLVGQRLFQTPKWTGSIGAMYRRQLGTSISAFASADVSYVSDQLSGTSSVTSPLIRPSYSLVNTRVGLTTPLGELSLFIENLTNERANFGDTQTLAFRRTYLGLPLNRVAVSRPMTVGVQFRHGFQ